MRSIKLGIFVSQFFNTGILILLSTANLKEQNLPFLSTLFDDGPNTDFNSSWYRDVAPIIVTTLLIGAIMPVIGFITKWLNI